MLQSHLQGDAGALKRSCLLCSWVCLRGNARLASCCRGPSFPVDSCGSGIRQSEGEEQREAWGPLPSRTCPLPARRERRWEVCSHWDNVHFRHQLPLLQSLPKVSQHSFSFGGTDLLKRTLRNWPP